MLDTILTLSAVTILLFSLYLFRSHRQKWKNYPPGPRRYPIFGNLLQLGPQKDMHLTYYKWAEKYGPIMRVDLAGKKTVVISDLKLLKSIFSDSNYSGRMDLSLYDVTPDGIMHGIAMNEGKHWEEIRRFVLKQLKDLGLGKNSMEALIMLEVNEMLEILKEEVNGPISNIRDKLHLSVVNSLWNIVAGTRYSRKDTNLLRITENVFSATTNSSILLFLPILKTLMPHYSGYNKMRKAIQELSEFFQKSVDHRKISLDEGQTPFTFIDAFIKKIRVCEDKESAFYGKTGEENLIGVLNDLYFAGVDTSSTSLGWLILKLSQAPDIQRKLQKEIEAITGNMRQVSVADRASMPYAEAVITEGFRYASALPLGVNHRAQNDGEILGYTIPKDTLITSNIYYIHNDPKIWGKDADQFKPERFLSPDGKTFKKNEALVAFSTGKRQCPGESLGRDSVFLFTTNIFQKFNVEFYKYIKDAGVGSLGGFILSPEPYSVIVRERVF